MKFAVAFCADRNMEVPLHVAASSVLSNIAQGWTPVFYFMLADFSDRQKDEIRRTLDRVGGGYKAHFLAKPADKLLAGLHSLHGSMTPYFRLVLPDHEIEAERLLYLDSDTICHIDVTPLAGMAMPFPAGFVEGGVVSHYPEKAFFSNIGLSPDTTAFNSGVMLFDLAAWRSGRFTEQVFEICRRYPDELVAADQTALIAACAGNFTRLDARYNIHMYPSTPMQDPALHPGIYHFVGSPKPWDFAGRQLHASFPIYEEALQRTIYLRHRPEYARLSYWRRAYAIRGGYARTLLKLLRNEG